MPDTPNQNISLAVESDAILINFTRIDLWENLPRNATPTNGLYIVLLGTVTNKSTSSHCLYKRDFELRVGSQRYGFSGPARRASSYYDVTYPGSLLGQCVDAGEAEETLLLFDVDIGEGQIQLTFDATSVTLDKNLQTLLAGY